MKLPKVALKLISLVSGVALAVGLAAPVYAASASVYLSPSSTSVAKGSYLSISVRENSGSEPVNAAKILLSYPSSQLSYISISSSSAFSIVASNSGGGGNVTIERGALPAVSGNQTIATVKFKALTDTGKATVSVKSGSTVVSANSNTNIAAGLSGGTYSLTKPAPAPVAAPAAPKDTTPPKITDVKVTNVTFSTATITWTTSEPATSSVDYGLSKNYGLAGVDSNLVTAHKLVLNSPAIIPAQQYHFLVKSVDGSGNAASGTDTTFTTQGARVAVTVTDQHNKPVKGAKVSVLESSAETDKAGRATISTPDGKQTLVIDYKGHTYAQVINVNPPDANNTVQSFKSKITTKAGLFWPFILVLVLVAIVAWLIGKGGHGLRGLYDEALGLLPNHKPVPPTAKPVSTPAPTVVKPSKDA